MEMKWSKSKMEEITVFHDGLEDDGMETRTIFESGVSKRYYSRGEAYSTTVSYVLYQSSSAHWCTLSCLAQKNIFSLSEHLCNFNVG